MGDPVDDTPEVSEAVRALLDEYREEVASLTESFAARLLEVLEAEEEPEP